MKSILTIIIILSWLFFGLYLINNSKFHHLSKDKWEKTTYEGFIKEGTTIYIEKEQ